VTSWKEIPSRSCRQIPAVAAYFRVGERCFSPHWFMRAAAKRPLVKNDLYALYSHIELVRARLRR